jgi:Fe-S oxidoreductase
MRTVLLRWKFYSTVRGPSTTPEPAAHAFALATDCPLAALQIRQGTGRTARHPIRILAEAYGLDAEDPT